MKEDENELVDGHDVEIGYEWFQVCADTAKVECFEIRERYAIER